MSGIAFEDQFLGFLDGAIRQQKRMADRAMVQFIVLRLLMVAASALLQRRSYLCGKELFSVHR